jgi:hypothetical protein
VHHAQRRVVYTWLDIRCFDVVTTFVFATMSACLYKREQRCNNSHILEVICDIMMMDDIPYTRQAYQAPRHVWGEFLLERQLGGLDGGHVFVTDDLPAWWLKRYCPTLMTVMCMPHLSSSIQHQHLTSRIPRNKEEDAPHLSNA